MPTQPTAIAPWPPEEARFAEAVEQCTFPAADFSHKQHLRLAWLYLRAEPFDRATGRMIATIRKFATSAGAPAKFHYTMTVAWMRLLDAAMDPAIADFDALLAANPALLSSKVLSTYYSDPVLQSTEARAHMVEPDRSPLPRPTVTRQTT